MAQDRLNPALRWFAAICVAGFISGGCLRCLFPHDLHPAKSVRVDPAAVSPESSVESPASHPSVIGAPAPVSQPPATQQVMTVQSADADPLPPQPDQPRTNSL